jgi:BirA family biotin operon repressor/biotin-[acetyl-CoA-carboxylase] ligase
MLALGLGVQEAIGQTTGLAADLRWPNDVLIDGRKCAGILAQLEADAVIAGIGINVSHTEFPAEIANLATSLLLAGARVAREDLLVALVNAVEGCCKILADNGAPAILRMFERASSYAFGRRVRVAQDQCEIVGVTCGLDASGFLKVRTDDGKETTILAGGVRPA